MFSYDLLGECAHTDFPDGLFQFRVYHDSDDGWCMHSVMLRLTNLDTVGCIPGVFLDGNEHYTCDL